MQINNAIISGNMTQDPELKTTQNGKTFCTFSIASNRSYKTSDGTRKKETSFFDVVCFVSSVAENTVKYCKKGNEVVVLGEFVMETWEADDGTRRRGYKIRAQNIQFAPQRGNDSVDAKPADKPTSDAAEGKPENKDDLPF